MKQVTWTITENTPLTPDTYRLRLAGDTEAITAPGQFVNLKLSGFYLRRPISVCDWEPGAATLIYKVLGHGTAAMTHLPAGTELDVLTGLGNGYDTSLAGERPLLVGGGVGIPPLYGLARRLTAEHRQVTACWATTGRQIFFWRRNWQWRLSPSAPHRRTAAPGPAALSPTGMEGVNYTHLYTCGPEAMLHAVWQRCRTDGQFSFEERMGCGFGACMGCTCRTKYGHKRICKDGPVLRREEIVW